MSEVFGLIDCNDFYVRLARPLPRSPTHSAHQGGPATLRQLLRTLPALPQPAGGLSRQGHALAVRKMLFQPAALATRNDRVFVSQIKRTGIAIAALVKSHGLMHNFHEEHGSGATGSMAFPCGVLALRFATTDTTA